MKRVFAAALAALFLTMFVACGDADTNTSSDGDSDIVAETDTDAPDTDPDPDAIADTDPDAEPDDDTEVAEETEETPADGDIDAEDETPETEAPDSVEDTDPEPDLPDTDPDPDTTTGFCRAITDCLINEVCNFALGRCEPRGIAPEPELTVFGFHPLAGAPGDLLVIDGRRFYATMMGAMNVSVSIGGTQVSAFGAAADENRVLLPVTANIAGVITVSGEGGLFDSSDTAFVQTATGVLQCDGSTPYASGVAGATVDDMGPYAVGYVDFLDIDTRLFYPAACGGIRRPAAAGTWPFVAILHGNGALHINYEYLAGMLASWGFVSVMPASEHNNEYDQEVINNLRSIIARFRGKDISAEHPCLAGVSTTADIAMVGHSRGCARMQGVWDEDADVAAHGLATVFLGPADENIVAPGLFMTIGGTEDQQSFPYAVQAAYDRQHAPRWKFMIQGGNHSLFSDHKVYSMFDGAAQIWRRQQLRVVTSFVLPLMQRAFGQDEPFGDRLDNPPADPIYVTEYQLH